MIGWLVILSGVMLEAGALPRPHFRLVSPAEHARYLGFIPNGLLGKIDARPEDLIFYTQETTPRVFQKWDNQLQGLHDAFHNISADRSEPVGNPNREAPWNTGGMDRSANGRSVKFLLLPRGMPQFMRLFRMHLRRDSNPAGTWQWLYRRGTIFVEIGLVSDGLGTDWPFMARVMTKMSDAANDWDVDELRPVRTRAEYYQLTGAVEPSFLTRASFPSAHRVFSSEGFTEELAPISREKVIALLRRPFVSVKDERWTDLPDGPSYGPTTRAEFHIVPRGTDTALIAVNRDTCLKCHLTTGMHADDFDGRRDWYGRVRGSDGIFSFHVFDNRFISHNGAPVNPQIRQDLASFLSR